MKHEKKYSDFGLSICHATLALVQLDFRETVAVILKYVVYVTESI